MSTLIGVIVVISIVTSFITLGTKFHDPLSKPSEASGSGLRGFNTGSVIIRIEFWAPL